MTSEPASEPTAPVEVPPQGAPNKSSAPLIAVLAVLALGGAAAVSFPMWRGHMGMPGPAGMDSFEVENLRAELSAATNRIAQLEARPAAAPGAMDNARLDRLEEALKTAQGHAAGPAGEIDSLAKQVADLKRNSAEASAVLRLAERLELMDLAIRELQARRSSAAALLLAAGQLREAVAAGRPFDAEWRAARVLAGEDAESLALLDGLKEQAAAGIATRAALVQRFDALAPALIRAEILPEGDGWWRHAADRLLSLITIRREDGATIGQNAAAIIGRAQAALTRGDFAAALTELEFLSPGPAEAARPWIAEAKARQGADKALSQLTAQAVALAGAKP
ncbi:mitofilin family membrane protein [Magnetospirillum sp. 15-1]|uniref:COG4223 family protein n=1 Tax=Magnetospirillum sp. 15-1 TaxID=1979370 RepID=UPI000BBC5067|nr:mitofilin family membrane protein [Magnetospirillum sp. 15-1]